MPHGAAFSGPAVSPNPPVLPKTYEIYGLKMSRDMFPCVQGFKDMFTIGYPPEIQKYKPSDFYDESFVTELKKSGFIDNVYKTAK